MGPLLSPTHLHGENNSLPSVFCILPLLLPFTCICISQAEMRKLLFKNIKHSAVTSFFISVLIILFLNNIWSEGVIML